jgi:hypothetical protein
LTFLYTKEPFCNSSSAPSFVEKNKEFLFLIKSYLIKNKNSLFFSTKLGALDELQKGSLVYKKVKNKTLLNNNIGILVSKNKIINQITEKFLETLTKNFKKF